MSYYETNKKDDSTQPFTNRRATTRLSRFILAPQCSRGQFSPPAQRRCLPRLSPQPGLDFSVTLNSFHWSTQDPVQVYLPQGVPLLVYRFTAAGMELPLDIQCWKAHTTCSLASNLSYYIYTNLLRIVYIRTLRRTIGSCCGLHHYLEDHHRPM